MASEFTMLNLLNGSQDRPKLKVRVIRLWKHKSSYSSGDGNAIEMILVDEEGHKIHASIKRGLMKHFDGVLKEGVVYCLSKFNVGENKTTFKMVPHAHRIHLALKTTVIEATGPFGGPINEFNFADFTAIRNFEVDKNLALDVIGVLHSCGKLMDKNVSGRDCKLISFELESVEGVKLECSLWDPFAQQLSEYVSKHSKTIPIVVVIQIGKIHDFMGLVQVTNCFHGTKVFLDAHVAEITEFRTAYLARNNGGSQQHPVLEFMGRGGNSMVSDFLSLPRKNIDELCDIKKIGKHVVVARIIALRMEPTWSYLACYKCFGGLEEDDDPPEHVTGYLKTNSVGLWKCNKCQLRGVDPVRRFRIQIRAQDATGTTSFTLFDRDVSEVVKKSAQELYAQLPLCEEEEILPVELNVLLVRRPAFKISVTDWSLKTKNTVLTVSRMTESPEIMDKLVGPDTPDEITIVSESVAHACSKEMGASSSSNTDKKRLNDEATLQESGQAKRHASVLLTPKKEDVVRT